MMFTNTNACSVQRNRQSTACTSTVPKKIDNKKGLEEHISAVHKYKCPQCATAFKHKVLLKNHQKGKMHCYCGDCNKAFGSSLGLTSHLQSSRHQTEFHCCDFATPKLWNNTFATRFTNGHGQLLIVPNPSPANPRNKPSNARQRVHSCLTHVLNARKDSKLPHV